MFVCLAFFDGAALVAALAARLTTPLAVAAGFASAISVTAALGSSSVDWRAAAARAGGRLRVSMVVALLTGALLAGRAWQTRGLPVASDGASVSLSGVVTGVAASGAISIRGPLEPLPGSPRRTVQVYPQSGWKAVTPGERVMLSGVLTLPRPPENPGGFDYQVYARVTGIAGTVKVSALVTTRNASPLRRLAALPGKAGQRAAAVLDRLFPEPDATLLYGLVFGGDSSDLPATMAADFRRAGVLHLLAASGSNVAFILGAVVWALRRFFLNRQALKVGLAVVVAYWLMTGGGASIGRAAVMAIIVIAAQLVRRQSDALTSLAFAAALLTLINPLTPLDIGFQLSFSATWGLLRISPAIRAWLRARGLPDWLAAPAAVTLGAQIGVLPLAMNSFGEQSLISPLTNLIALPLAGGAVVTGSLCCLLGAIWLPLAVPAAAVTAVMLRLLTASVAIGARAPFAAVALPAMPACWTFAYYAFAALVTAQRPQLASDSGADVAPSRPSGPATRDAGRARVVALALALAMVAVALRPANSGPGGGLRITFIDVRQGDSALIELPGGRRMLVDCGDFAGGAAAAEGGATGAFAAGPGGKYDAAGRALIPFFRRANIRTLDAVIITHDHADHNGGLAGLRQAVRVAAVLTDSELMAGQSYDLDGASVAVLWPPAADRPPGNDASVVLRLSYAGHSALLTGDIEAAAEGALLAGGASLRADLLKVAHHGGASSTSATFLAAVRPKVAVISVGASNPFGHPSLEAVARLVMAKAQILRTDRLGAIRVAFDDSGMRAWHWDGRAWRRIALTGTLPVAAKLSDYGLQCRD